MAQYIERDQLDSWLPVRMEYLCVLNSIYLDFLEDIRRFDRSRGGKSGVLGGCAR